MTHKFVRHPREGGGPSPDRQVGPRVLLMGSRLRGNGEVRDKVSRYPPRYPVLDTGLGSFLNGADKSQAPHQVRGDDLCTGEIGPDLFASSRRRVRQK